MGRKLAGVTGIIVAALAFGLGTAAEAGHSTGQHGSHHVIAEDKGPTFAHL